jgi:IS1 family transposase
MVGNTESKREKIPILELYELFTYVKKTNQIRVWTAVDRNRLCFTGFEVGSASTKAFRTFWRKITETKNIEISCTDGNPLLIPQVYQLETERLARKLSVIEKIAEDEAWRKLWTILQAS